MKTPAERVEQIEEWHNLAHTEDEEWRARAEDAYDTYWGDTWLPEEVEACEAKNAPHLSINKTQPKINMMSAIQRMGRFDVRIRARVDEGDIEIAEILTHLIKQIDSDNNIDFIEAWAFLDSLITGRGYTIGDISYHKNFFGDIVFRYATPFSIKFDPTAIMPDLSDAMYVMEERWMSLEQIKSKFGVTSKRRDQKKLENIFYNSAATALMTNEDYFVSGTARAKLRPYKVVQCWYREDKVQHFLADVQTGDLHPVTDNEEGEQIVQQHSGRFYLIEAVNPKIFVTTVCNGVELAHSDSPFSSDLFPIFPNFCLLAGGRQDGFVHAMKDPQLEVNKRRSQMLHLINQHGNVLTLVEQNAVAEKGGIEWLKQNLNKPGLVVTMRQSMLERLKRLTPGDIPQGLVLLEQLAGKDFFDVVGVNVETLPSSSMGSGASGRAVSLRQQQGMTLLSLPLDNQRLTRRARGRWTLSTIQDYYTTERVVRLEGEDGGERFLRVNQQTPGGRLNDITLRKYDVAVSEDPTSATSRQAAAAILGEMVHQGVPIPPDVVIEMSDMPRRAEVLKRVRDYMASQGAGEQQRAEGSKEVRNASSEKVRI